eukprot:COSAG05_NODE_13121_length_441_cov_0.736842_1_plen_31_part_10
MKIHDVCSPAAKHTGRAPGQKSLSLSSWLTT